MKFHPNPWMKVLLALAVGSGAMAQTVEQKHFIQANGPYANSNTFKQDLTRYADAWAFFEGRSVEFNGSLTFVKRSMTEEQFAADRSRLTGFTSSTLSRNYARILCTAQYTAGNPSATWDLWKDADRDAVINNFRILARQARLVGLKGIFVDPETYPIYGYNPWRYADHAAPAWSKNASGTWVNAHTFASTQVRMQDLGARIMTAIEAEAPGTRILLAQGLGLLNGLCYDANGNAVASVDPAKWANHDFGLYASFIAGLSSKVYKCRLVDMQENVGYWATSEADLKAGNAFLYDLGPRLLLPAAVIPVYRSYIHWGYMLYTDALFRLGSSKDYLSGWMLASERPAFASALAYWALKNASGRGGGYAEVIIYTENKIWGTTWGGTTVTYPPSQSIPDSFATALNNYRNGVVPQDVTQIVAAAWQRKAQNNWPSN